MKSSFIKINGIRHKVYTWGKSNKPKLFFIHGWLDTGASFDFTAPYLEKHFHIIAPDLRGYGKSEHANNPLGYFLFEYVADIITLINHFEPKKKVRLMGHSLGGALTSIVCGTYPERFSHFINMEGFGFLKEPVNLAPERARKWLHAIDQVGFPPHPSLESFSQRLLKNDDRLTPDRALFLARHITKKHPKGVIMAADPKHKLIEPYTFSLPQFYAFWENIQAKCLLVEGKNTGMALKFKHKDFRREMRMRFKHFPKNTQRIMIPDCGHMIHHDRPEIIGPEFLKFLRS